MVIGSDTFGTAPPGGLRVAPASWHRDTPEQAAWFAASATSALAQLVAYEPEIVLVGHGSPVLTGGGAALPAALEAAAANLNSRSRLEGFPRTPVPASRALVSTLYVMPQTTDSRPSGPAPTKAGTR